MSNRFIRDMSWLHEELKYEVSGKELELENAKTERDRAMAKFDQRIAKAQEQLDRAKEREAEAALIMQAVKATVPDLFPKAPEIDPALPTPDQELKNNKPKEAKGE